MDTYYPEFNIDLNDFSRGLPDEVMDIINPKKHRRDILVEDCYILSLSDLGKGLLQPINEWREDYPKPLDLEVKPEGKSGSVILVSRRGKLKVNFSVDLEDPPILNVFYFYRNCGHDQAVDLGAHSINYGIRPYLYCLCGYRANCLYLTPKESTFMCRKCAGLFYESTTVNKNTVVGGMGYVVMQTLKLDELKAKIKRWTYANKPTKRAMRIINKLGKYASVQVALKLKTEQLQI